ncbi:hypothetical protein AK812_SmicGene42008 [Symbiodinium microadriaticum]|uniref:Selenoprotein O n=1 Tax=Symbiodinium microadriaticum TaxID=2951 RepID=A0A1Q9C4M5_SYMMI|nr:hypothetical protein AK812_SmicGene42008 [Symbiodinium microadriaticum]CAE7673730.1 selO [Symbiodinium sp. KB8]CAE7863953.1 selO [Symbiodinium microadriaticum]
MIGVRQSQAQPSPSRPQAGKCRSQSQHAPAPHGFNSLLGAAVFGISGARGVRRRRQLRQWRVMQVLPAGLSQLQDHADHSWIRELSPDPQQELHEPNREKRLVSAGHYVQVKPTPLLNSCLVACSSDMADQLGLSEADCQSEDFLQYVSGHMESMPKMRSWCTPYTLSVAGNEITTGNMYGDGRAISVGEVSLGNGKHWELQLKGAGTTPFCRGADGRAVIRSSLREFLASEAMHHLRVPTTRCLSLVVSRSESALREWLGERVYEPCAITCRVARSFLRVGHLELFGRRARDSGYKPESLERRELEQIVRHLIAREYPECFEPAEDTNLQAPLRRMLLPMARRMARLTAEWWRVGFCQGNFQSDNCLLGGRTMDYGPFGFMEKYNPNWCSWTDGIDKFSFRDQPKASYQNFTCAIRSIECLLDTDGRKEAQSVLRAFPSLLADAFAEVRMQKLGLSFWDDRGAELCDDLLSLMEQSGADWTLTWRCLATIAQDWDELMESGSLLAPLQRCFYQSLSPDLERAWSQWLWEWLTRLREEGDDADEVADRMRQVSPKYVPRNWMLMDAYQSAESGSFQLAQELLQLFSSPYDEHPEFESRYFRLAPPEVRTRPGIYVMS